ILAQKLAVLLVAALGIGLGAFNLLAAGPQADNAVAAEAPEPDRAKAKAPARDDRAAATFAGRVLDPDGKPVARARVYITRHDGKTKEIPKPLAVTGEAGRFHFTVPKANRTG